MDIYLSDDTPRVPCVIVKIIEKVKETAQNTKSVWIRMREALDKALTIFPEARITVMQAIEEEFLTDNGENRIGSTGAVTKWSVRTRWLGRGGFDTEH